MSLNTDTTMQVVPAYGSNGGGFGWGGDWSAWIILFLIWGAFGGGWGNGFGGGFGGANGPGFQGYATRSDINEGFALNGLQNGQTSIRDAVTSGFHGVDTAVCQLGYNTQQGFNSLASQLASCCCETQSAIQGVRYDIATSAAATQNTIQNTTRDIIDNQNANSRAILDFLTQDKIATLTAENQSLKFQASQTAQNAYLTATMDANQAELIRRLGRDCPVPAYMVPNPNCCYNTCGTCV